VLRRAELGGLRLCHGEKTKDEVQPFNLNVTGGQPLKSKDDICTKVTMFAPQSMRQMNKEDKVRACYQHCCLQYVAGGKMTNETLRGRLSIAASNYSIASRIISDTIAAGLIKLEDSSKSRKYAQYIPIWA